MSRSSLALTVLGLVLVLGPFVAYLVLVFVWPWPIDQGCYQYNCSYGINTNLSRAFWVYTPYVPNLINPVCSSGIVTRCIGTYGGNSSDSLAILNWLLSQCQPMRDGVVLLNGTACYS